MLATVHVLPVIICIGLLLTGCGTYVPEIQEIYSDQADGQLLVQAIVRSIHCEIKDAVTYVIAGDEEDAKRMHRPPLADWLLDWGAQIQITLTIDEQSSLTPSGFYSPMNIFSLFGGAGVSSEATRIETLNYYYTVKDLYYSRACLLPQDIADSHSVDHPLGSLLIQSDLKLREWLLSVVTGNLTGDISITDTANKNAKNGIAHQVTFRIITTGNITPTWKLVHATINPTPPLFLANRARTHDLLITFGPNETTTIAGQAMDSLGPNTPAAGTFLASQIGLAIRNQMINNLSP